MTTTAMNVENYQQVIGYALIRTRSQLTTTQIITTERGLENIIEKLEQEDLQVDAYFLFYTAIVSAPRCVETRIVLAKLEILIEEFRRLGLDSESLRLCLARNIAQLQRRELLRELKGHGDAVDPRDRPPHVNCKCFTIPVTKKRKK